MTVLCLSCHLLNTQSVDIMVCISSRIPLAILCVTIVVLSVFSDLPLATGNVELKASRSAELRRAEVGQEPCSLSFMAWLRETQSP